MAVVQGRGRRAGAALAMVVAIAACNGEREPVGLPASLENRAVARTMTIAPAAASIVGVGATQQFSAEVGTGARLHWESSAPDVATVDDAGLATARGVGRAIITARGRGVSGTAALEVRPAFASVSAGVSHDCALTASGVAYCWGGNSVGQLGDGTTADHPSPLPVAGGLTFAMVSAGWLHTCGVTTSGAAYCWGGNQNGQLGDGTTTGRTTPTSVAGGLVFVQVSAGSTVTCGVTTGGAVYCWGDNGAGQLGAAGSSVTPVLVADAARFASVSVGTTHACAVATDGTAYCWGLNNDGELGNGTRLGGGPAPVVGGLRFSTVSAGGFHTCGVTTDGVAYCWGMNLFKSVGDGTATQDDRLTPSPVAGDLRFTSLTAALLGKFSDGPDHSCGLTVGGAAYCWGGFGRNFPTVGSYSPVPVPGGGSFTAVSAAGFHSCGLTATGEVFCWGGQSDTMQPARVE